MDEEDLEEDEDIEEASLDDGYWDLDELGIDPEEFYDLCRRFPSVKLSRPTSSGLIL